MAGGKAYVITSLVMGGMIIAVPFGAYASYLPPAGYQPYPCVNSYTAASYPNLSRYYNRSVSAGRYAYQHITLQSAYRGFRVQRAVTGGHIQPAYRGGNLQKSVSGGTVQRAQGFGWIQSANYYGTVQPAYGR